MRKGHELIKLLAEIREACTIATSMDDVSINAVIEEIDRLAVVCIEQLKVGGNKK